MSGLQAEPIGRPVHQLFQDPNPFGKPIALPGESFLAPISDLNVIDPHRLSVARLGVIVKRLDIASDGRLLP